MKTFPQTSIDFPAQQWAQRFYKAPILRLRSEYRNAWFGFNERPHTATDYRRRRLTPVRHAENNIKESEIIRNIDFEKLKSMRIYMEYASQKFKKANRNHYKNIYLVI